MFANTLAYFTARRANFHSLGLVSVLFTQKRRRDVSLLYFKSLILSPVHHKASPSLVSVMFYA